MSTPKKKRSTQIRNFVFTWNNPGKLLMQEFIRREEEINPDVTELSLAYEYLEHLYEHEILPIRYIIYGEEYGEEGTLHLQGYCELARRVAFSTITEHFVGCHIERRMGSSEQAADYCRKGGKYISHGTQKVQGNRTDLQYIKSLLDNNSSVKALLDEGEIDTPQELAVVEKLLRWTDKPRTTRPNVVWLCGESGTGKTYTARQVLPNAFFKTNSSHKWWPAYDGEEDIIIDDVRRDLYPFINMLGLLDRYPYQVEDKGTIRQFRGVNIIITAPKPPEEVYSTDKEIYRESMYQLNRRINMVLGYPPNEISIQEAWEIQNEQVEFNKK